MNICDICERIDWKIVFMEICEWKIQVFMNVAMLVIIESDSVIVLEGIEWVLLILGIG